MKLGLQNGSDDLAGELKDKIGEENIDFGGGCAETAVGYASSTS